MKKRLLLIGLLVAMITMCMGSSVSARTEYVYLTADEYADASDVFTVSANDTVYYYGYNSTSSAHKIHVYAECRDYQSPLYSAVRSALISEGSSVSGSASAPYTTEWSTQLNVQYWFKNCIGNGYMRD